MSDEGKEAEKPPARTMEEILAEVTLLKAQASKTRATVNPLPLWTAVRLSAAAHKDLARSKGGTRIRDKSEIGEVVGFDDQQGRIMVLWQKPVAYVEQLAPKYIEMVEG